ncbi:hypothetical protein Tco_0381439 [Tanacetum coccineum]
MTITLMSVSANLDVTYVVALLMNPLTVIKRPPPTIGNQGLLISDPMNPLKSGFTKETNMFQMSVHDYLKRLVWYLDSGCSRHITGVKQYLHRYSKESGPKVVFRDNSSGDTEGYGSVNYNRITFTRVAYVNGLKHNLISISQLCDANFKVLKMGNLNEVRVKELRSDNGTKFRNHKLEEFYDEKGIS